MNKFILPFVTTMLTVTICFGQTASNNANQHFADSMKNVFLEQAALRNPVLRQLVISTDLIAPGEIKSQLNHVPLFSGRANTIRTTITFTVPVISWGKNTFSLTGSYAQARLQVTNLQSFQPGLSDGTLTFNKSTFGLSPSIRRIDSLFGRQVFFLASATGLSNDFTSLKRISYLFTAVFPIKQTQNSRIGLGLVVNIDPSLKIPAFVLVNYWHKFNDGIEFTANVPSEISFRKVLSQKLWVTLGTTLGGSVAFFNLDYPGVPRDANYTTIDLKTGAGLEYRVGRKLIFSINSGLLTPLSARAFDRTKSTSDYFLRNYLSNTPYINFGFSVLPFIK